MKKSSLVALVLASAIGGAAVSNVDRLFQGKPTQPSAENSKKLQINEIILIPNDEYKYRIAGKPDAPIIKLKYVGAADSEQANLYINDRLVELGDGLYHPVGIDDLMIRRVGFAGGGLDGYKVILITNRQLEEVTQ